MPPRPAPAHPMSVSCTWSGSTANSLGWSGPRSWSQYLTGADSCKMAVIPASLRSWRSRASSSAVLSFPALLARGDTLPPGDTPDPEGPEPPAMGSTGDLTTIPPASLATSTAVTPPGRAATTRASPPAAGSSHSAATSSESPLGPVLFRPGSGRLEVNSSDPSGRKRGLASPSADRVSRRAGPPWVSIRQMLVRYFLASALSVCTAAASQVPSGASRSVATRGIATKSLRSWNGVEPALTSSSRSNVDMQQFGSYPHRARAPSAAQSPARMIVDIYPRDHAGRCPRSLIYRPHCARYVGRDKAGAAS